MRTTTRVAAAAALVLTLTACGSSDDTTTAPTTTAAATPTTTPTPEVTAEPEPEGPSPDELYATLSQAFTDATTYRTSTTITSSAGTSTQVADVAVTDGTVATAVTSTAAGVESQVVVVDGQTYLGLGELGQGLFVRIDADDTNPLAAALSSLDAISDPTAAVAPLKDAITAVEVVGDEDVDGVAATHYALTLDPTATADLGAALGAGATADPSTEAPTYDLWLDGQSRPSRLSATVQGTQVETTYTDWGDPSIVVTAPGPDEISPYTLDQLLAAGMLG